jgi:hypothetical protein
VRKQQSRLVEADKMREHTSKSFGQLQSLKRAFETSPEFPQSKTLQNASLTCSAAHGSDIFEAMPM